PKQFCRKIGSTSRPKSILAGVCPGSAPPITDAKSADCAILYPHIDNLQYEQIAGVMRAQQSSPKSPSRSCRFSPVYAQTLMAQPTIWEFLAFPRMVREIQPRIHRSLLIRRSETAIIRPAPRYPVIGVCEGVLQLTY